MIINVTQEHIDRGYKANCTFCPIALAVRPYGEISMLRVDNSSIWIYDYSQQYSRFKLATLPDKAIEFITDFDTKDHYGSEFAKPFSFHISAECFMR